MRVISYSFDDITLSGYENDYVLKKIIENSDFYEHSILKRWDRFITNDSIVFDIGANLGNHSVYFSKKTKAKKIHSFEPAQINFELLKTNCIQNQCTNIQFHNFAIGYSEGRASLNINNMNLGMSSVTPNTEGSIEIKRLDNLDLEHPHFVKIDVEGFELEVLKGMEGVLIKSRPILWVEVTCDTVKLVCTFLAQYEYRIVDFFNFNVLFISNTSAAISEHEMLYRHLELLKKSWEIKAESSEKILQAKQKEVRLINELELVIKKRKALLEDFDKKKADSEFILNRTKLLLHDLEVNKQKQEDLVKVISKLKNEKESYIKIIRELKYALEVGAKNSIGSSSREGNYETTD
ncbi:FkbM family methyltransferase [Paenibacillus lautus]|uniref:FkbM family methyltransferase n=1 Tax=Paenibacillus lautus TaxID=1401 RepID=UPI002DB93CAD|nr:FkbM family methyltransferase [Paenibacillus lautus]MEC0258396.1 FkbM family methyltransferase [Paenibacillus lautus]